MNISSGNEMSTFLCCSGWSVAKILSFSIFQHVNVTKLAPGIPSVLIMGNVHVNMVMLVVGAVNVNLTFIVHQLTKNVQVFYLLIITLMSVWSFVLQTWKMLRAGIIRKASDTDKMYLNIYNSIVKFHLKY